MKKAIILLAVFAVFLAGCGEDKTFKQEINLDNMDRKVEILPAIVGGAQTNWESIKQNEFPKPDIIEIAKIKKPFQKWQAKPFEGSGKLEKKWELAFEHNESEHPYSFTGMPNGWSVLSSHHYKGRFMVGVIDPATGLFTKKSYGQGITDGEYEFIDHSYGPNSAYCRRLSDDKKMWDNLSSNRNNGQTEYYIINGMLIYVCHRYQTNPRFQDAIAIYRVNPTNGEIIWGIKSKPTSKELFTYHFAHCFSINNHLYVSLEESTRKSDRNDEKLEDNTYLYKVDVENGNVNKIDVKCSTKNSFITDHDGKLFIKSENGELKIFNIITSAIDSYSIKSSKRNNDLAYNRLDIHSIINDRIYYTYYNSRNNSYSMYYSGIENPVDIHPVIFNNSNEFKTISILNKTLYCLQNKKLIGLDPISLEPAWEINLENTDEYTELAWLDWRGVLVVSEKEMACYAPK